MGIYTEFVLGVDLKRDTPRKVIDILKYLLDDELNIILDDHPLFNTENWQALLLGNSAYFKGCTNSRLEEPRHYFDNWHLSVRSSLKNYDYEIELFLNWLSPYMIGYGFVGYMYHDGLDDPWLIYNGLYDDNHVCLYKIRELDNITTLDDRWMSNRAL